MTVAEELCSGMGLETGLTATLLRHRDRLEVVRTTKVEQKASDLPMDEDVGPQSDLYSDTSSRASTRSSTRSRSSHSSGSRSSRKTHRSKRRDRAKQTSLREGGMFEEVNLLSHAPPSLSFYRRSIWFVLGGASRCYQHYFAAS